MKKVTRYNYNKRKDSPNGHWFRVYDIFCDRCGKRVVNDYITLKEPKTDEKDYCLACLRECIDKQISM